LELDPALFVEATFAVGGLAAVGDPVDHAEKGRDVDLDRDDATRDIFLSGMHQKCPKEKFPGQFEFFACREMLDAFCQGFPTTSHKGVRTASESSP